MAKKKFESYMYETARLEGGLFVRDLLEKIMIGAGTYQNAKDYGIVSSIFTDAAALAWQDAQKQVILPFCSRRRTLILRWKPLR